MIRVGYEMYLRPEFVQNMPPNVHADKIKYDVIGAFGDEILPCLPPENVISNNAQTANVNSSIHVINFAYSNPSRRVTFS